jgi:hypothetical protein
MSSIRVSGRKNSGINIAGFDLPSGNLLFCHCYNCCSLIDGSNVLLVLFPRSLRLILESILQEVFRLQRRTARRLQKFLREKQRRILLGFLLLLFHRTPILSSRFRLLWLLMFQMIGWLFLRIVQLQPYLIRMCLSDTCNHQLLWLCPHHQLPLCLFYPIQLYLKIIVYPPFRTQPLVNYGKLILREIVKT